MAPNAAEEKAPKLPVQQLLILSICRFAEPIALTGVFPYLPEMIESFQVSKEDVAHWAGVTSLVFSLAQAVTSIQWGRASDRFGRKPVIMTALFCTMTTTLLFGFSQSLTWAIVVRALAGASNGNVGILRTTVAELVPHKSLQPTAFSVMPIVWSVGASIGPIIGGALALPAKQYPDLFAGNHFFERFPFALPGLVTSVFFTVGLVSGILFLKETLEDKKHRKDYGLMLGEALTRGCRGKRIRLPKSPDLDQEAVPTSPQMARKHPWKVQAPPKWAEVFSAQSTLNIVAYTILAFHAVTFDQLVPVFLHYSLQDHSPSSGNVKLPFKFSGGHGLESGRIGFLFTMMGIVGIVGQFFVFPSVTRRFGSLRCFRTSTFVLPFIYFLLPYTVLLPTTKSREGAVFALMFVKGIVGTFSFPWTTILLTNSATSLRILGTLNGVAVGTSALGRATGPYLSGSAFSWGVKRGYVIVPWFLLGTFAVVGHIVTWWLIEMEGPTSSSREEGKEDESTSGGEEEEEIALLAQEDAAVTGPTTGLEINFSDDDLRRRGEEEGANTESVGETSPLLKAVPMGKSASSTGSTSTFGSTDLSRIPSR